MNQNKTVTWILALSLVFALSGCGKNTNETTAAPSAESTAQISTLPSTTASGETRQSTESSQNAADTNQGNQDIAASIQELEQKDAAPSDFIGLAKSKVPNANAEEITALAQSLLNAQKKYLNGIMVSYEKANENPEFSEIYSMDITKDLADKITDPEIKTLVADTYDNGLILKKEEGYVYPIIDIALFHDLFITHMSDAEGSALESEINEFNSGL